MPAGVIVTVADVVDVTTAIGAPGTAGVASGVTELEGPEDPDVPPALVAVDVKVYAVPFVRPVTRHDVEGDVTVQVPPAGTEVTK